MIDPNSCCALEMESVDIYGIAFDFKFEVDNTKLQKQADGCSQTCSLLCITMFEYKSV